MQALCCGLGMMAIVLSVTIKCVPLVRCLEVSYIGSIHDILDTWSINSRSSMVQCLFWFPFSELTIMSYMNETVSHRSHIVSIFTSQLKKISQFEFPATIPSAYTKIHDLF